VGLDFEEYLTRPKRRFEKLNEETFLMDSRFPISEANEVLGISLPATGSYTIDGLVMARLQPYSQKG